MFYDNSLQKSFFICLVFGTFGGHTFLASAYLLLHRKLPDMFHRQFFLSIKSRAEVLFHSNALGNATRSKNLLIIQKGHTSLINEGLWRHFAFFVKNDGSSFACTCSKRISCIYPHNYVFSSHSFYCIQVFIPFKLRTAYFRRLIFHC